MTSFVTRCRSTRICVKVCCEFMLVHSGPVILPELGESLGTIQRRKCSRDAVWKFGLIPGSRA